MRLGKTPEKDFNTCWLSKGRFLKFWRESVKSSKHVLEARADGTSAVPSIVATVTAIGIANFQNEYHKQYVDNLQKLSYNIEEIKVRQRVEVYNEHVCRMKTLNTLLRLKRWRDSNSASKTAQPQRCMSLWTLLNEVNKWMTSSLATCTQITVLWNRGKPIVYFTPSSHQNLFTPRCVSLWEPSSSLSSPR